MDEQDQWLEGNDNSAKAVVSHFQSKFTRDAQITDFDALNCIEIDITDDDNNMHSAIPTIQEIKDGVFAMD